ncbi:hypothetical protein [Nitrosovibrio sp. Nv6]|uniref:hypothetical protein n=1 Tax=Nitrosovibrio sp. Nv6 TaxID=1855340 RepID=UPI0008C9559D|nr:hypothetical protein [Nitrosovibrio sp. Nv6]SEO77349.1 hypothetical protein SAMN05216316_1054 [Nitrosovibrio sp. Nv6]
MRYATFKEDGRLKARYDDAFNVIPDGAIPLSPEIVELMAQTTEGYWELINGVVTHTVPPPPQLPINPVPTSISMRQARLALLQSGLLGQVDASIAAMPEASRIEWAFAATVERSHQLVAALAADLPLTSQQLDDLFTLGASL